MFLYLMGDMFFILSHGRYADLSIANILLAIDVNETSGFKHEINWRLIGLAGNGVSAMSSSGGLLHESKREKWPHKFAWAYGNLCTPRSVYMAVLLDKMGAMMVLPLLPFIARSNAGLKNQIWQKSRKLWKDNSTFISLSMC